MLQRIIDRLFLRRHFWRYATFSEVAELYASRLMTMFALRFVLMFSTVYLYKLGYSLVFLGLFWAGYFFLKALFAWPAAKIILRFGPKHGVLFASIVFASSMVLLYVADEVGIAAIAAWCVMQAFAGTLNNLSYTIDFSKVKHAEHAGKEIGYMNIIERVAAGLSPLLGGVVATLFGPAVMVVLAALLFLVSAMPLLRTPEPIKTRQPLRFSGFPWKATYRSIFANSSVGFDIFATGHAWTLLITVVILVADGQELYAKLGLFASLTILITVFAAYTFGKLIDRRRGRELLRAGVVVDALTHVSRPFVTGPVGIVAANAVNDTATTAYTMAFMRGVFDMADVSGFRVTYLYLMEFASNVGATIAALLFVLVSLLLPVSSSFMVFFAVTGLVGLGMLTARFPLYKK